MKVNSGNYICFFNLSIRYKINVISMFKNVIVSAMISLNKYLVFISTCSLIEQNGKGRRPPDARQKEKRQFVTNS